MEDGRGSVFEAMIDIGLMSHSRSVDQAAPFDMLEIAGRVERYNTVGYQTVRPAIVINVIVPYNDAHSFNQCDWNAGAILSYVVLREH